MLTPNNFVLTFGGCCYLDATFGENRSRNVTLRVHTDRHMQGQRQTEFIMCPMPNAIATGQIKTVKIHCVPIEVPTFKSV